MTITERLNILSKLGSPQDSNHYYKTITAKFKPFFRRRSQKGGGGQVGTMGASKPLPENKSPEDSNHFPEDDQDRIQTIVWIRITKRFKPLS